MRSVAMMSFALLLSVSLPAVATPIQWTIGSGGNGHYYEVVPSSNSLSWTAASAAAATAGGYLITVTSAAEQAFLETLPKNSGAYWAGGRDVAAEGVWRWAGGPEAGTQFWQGGAGGSATGPFNYANWSPGEPNNTNNNEDYMSWNQNSGGAGWNDIPHTNSAIKGYIIEYVPESSTFLLLGMGLYACARFGRRRRGSF